jgi:outer membrane protein assembly factor BamB
MSTLLRTLAAATLLAASQASAATGDWPQYGFSAQGRRENTQETVLSRKTVPHLVSKWTVRIRVDPSSAAAVANGIVYVGSLDHHLYALDARTGAQVWSAPTGGAVLSSPAVADGVVYVGSDDKNVYAFDAETGAIRWTAQTGATAVEAPLVVARGRVYAGTVDGHVLAIDAQTGVVRWTSAASYGVSAFSAPSVADGVVTLASGGSGILNAFDATSGVLLWSQSLFSSRFASPPAAYQGAVFVSDGFWLRAFDARTGQTRWTSGEGDARGSSTAMTAGHIYLVDSQGALDNYDTATGAIVKRTSTGQQMITTAPALANGVIYANGWDTGKAQSTMSAYDTGTGRLLWQSAGIAGVPIVANGMLYVANGYTFNAYGLP